VGTWIEGRHRSQTIPRMSVDEIISTLKHSSVASIVVEGNDDVIVLRAIEEDLHSYGVSLIVAGGRNSVLEIFKRRSELPAGLPVVFVADRDLGPALLTRSLLSRRQDQLRGRLEKDSTGRRFVIQAWDVDRTEPWPDGRHCQEDQALPV
jgi:hypothetical protein